MNNNIPCLNCKHFRKFYAKYDSSFKFLDRGICTVRDLTLKEQKKLPYINDCELWEKEALQEIQEKTVQAAVEDIKTKLDNLLEVLMFKECKK